MRLLAEAGHGGSARVDALKALGSADIPMGEFWNPQRFWVAKEAANAAHTYGRSIRGFYPNPRVVMKSRLLLWNEKNLTLEDLYIPNPGKKQPVIIIVHGDGPAGRSPSRTPNQIINCFLDIGFACLIYDKPGYGESTGKFTPGRLFEERASILLDAVAALKNHPFVGDTLAIMIPGILS